MRPAESASRRHAGSITRHRAALTINNDELCAIANQIVLAHCFSLAQTSPATRSAAGNTVTRGEHGVILAYPCLGTGKPQWQASAAPGRGLGERLTWHCWPDGVFSTCDAG